MFKRRISSFGSCSSPKSKVLKMGPARSNSVPAMSRPRETLALRLRQNWLAKHPVDVAHTTPLDDSLTSLNWLQNLNIMKITTPTPPSSPNLQDQKIPVPQFSFNSQVNPNAVLNMTNVPGRLKQEVGIIRNLGGIDITPSHVNSLEKIDYKNNPHIKPPYSYATLICMSMRESQKNKITLSGIYNWITENFMYYRLADPSWQNSIRHNLSLNKCFQKVPRKKDEPGKGGFWRINPEYQDMFVNGIFKKRRCSPVMPQENIRPPLLKKIKMDTEDSCSNSSMSSLSGLATAGAVQAILTPMNSIDETAYIPAAILVKQEPEEPKESKLTASGIFKQMAGTDLSDTIDFSWNAILNQDIEVSGIRVKTEDIIDDKDSAASPITALSPPPSDNSSDISLEDLLNTEFGRDLDNTVDIENGDALDLTVTGVRVKAPDWWAESLSSKQMHSFISPDNHSRMSTPIAPTDTDLDFSNHPWAEEKVESDEGMSTFDQDFSNLFDVLENIPSPTLSTDS